MFNIALTGVHFPEHQEGAYTIYGIGISLGYVISFILPIYFNTKIEMSVYIGLVIMVTITVSTLLVLVRRMSSMKNGHSSTSSSPSPSSPVQTIKYWKETTV